MNPAFKTPVIETAIDTSIGLAAGAAASRMFNMTTIQGGLTIGGFLGLKTALRHALHYSRGKDDAINSVVSAGAAASVVFARKGIPVAATVAAGAAVADGILYFAFKGSK